MSRPFSPWEIGLAMRYLRARKKESGVATIAVISFIGIMLAVAVLIIVMSVMNGFRTELLGRMLSFNGHMYVQGQPLYADDRDAMLARLAETPGVAHVAPLVESQSVARAGGQLVGVIVRGVRPEDLPAISIIAENVEPEALASFGQGPWGGDQVLIGQGLADILGVGRGGMVTLFSPTGGGTAFGSLGLEKTYEVGGAFKVGMSDYDRAFVYMPLEQTQLFFDKEGVWDVIEILLDDPDQARAMRPAIERAAGPGAVVSDWTDRNASFWEALQVERTVMRLILMLIVAIAAMNIISGVVMLVKNKGRDIAILRTMGATRSSILRVFFMAGASIGAAGTLAGLTLGVLFCIYIQPIQAVVERVTGASVFNPEVYLLSHIPARIEWSEVAIVVAWSLLAACVATLPPALRASRLDPVEALRYE